MIKQRLIDKAHLIKVEAYNIILLRTEIIFFFKQTDDYKFHPIHIEEHIKNKRDIKIYEY